MTASHTTRTSKQNLLTGNTENYTYDPIYELTQVAQAANTTESYTYDPVGNRLSSLGRTTWSYNLSNELTGTQATTFAYDNNGNMLSKNTSSGVNSYAWDFENRMNSATVTPAGGVASMVNFLYDPFGRRIQKTTASGSTVYLYDGANVVAELNGSGGVAASYAQGAGIDQPLAMQRGGYTAYYQADGLGSITSLSGSTGQPVATYNYHAFGATTATEGIFNPYRYTGREQDPETGLYYYRARYYDPSIGRFISEDPVRFYSGPNFYSYAWNFPVNYYDPSGLAPVPGQPPIPVPGGGAGNGWQWNPNPQNSRGGSWGPQTPIPGQGQPSASWDPEGHWDVDNGKGDRQRYDPNGKPITPEEAHGKCPSSEPNSSSNKMSQAIKNTTTWGEIVTGIAMAAFWAWNSIVN